MKRRGILSYFLLSLLLISTSIGHAQIISAKSLLFSPVAQKDAIGTDYLWNQKGEWIGGFSDYGRGCKEVYTLNADEEVVKLPDLRGKYTAQPRLSLDEQRILYGYAKIDLENGEIDNNEAHWLDLITADFPLPWQEYRGTESWKIQNAQWSTDEKSLILYSKYVGKYLERNILAAQGKREFPEERLSVIDVAADTVTFQLLDQTFAHDNHDLLVLENRIFAAFGGQVICWDLNKGDTLYTLHPEEVYPHHLLLTPDSSQLMVYDAGQRGNLAMYSLETGNLITVLETLGGAIQSPAFHPQLPLLIAAGEEIQIQCWKYLDNEFELLTHNIKDSYPIENPFYGHPIFHPDGTLWLNDYSGGNTQAVEMKITLSDSILPRLPFHEESTSGGTWIPQLASYRQNKFADTTQKVLNLVFEAGFRDSMCIYLNDSLLTYQWVDRGSFSTLPPNFSVDYRHLRGRAQVRIELVNKRKFIEFSPKPGYRQVFLERSYWGWNLLFSNYGRRYY